MGPSDACFTDTNIYEMGKSEGSDGVASLHSDRVRLLYLQQTGDLYSAMLQP